MSRSSETKFIVSCKLVVINVEKLKRAAQEYRKTREKKRIPLAFFLGGVCFVEETVFTLNVADE